MKRRAWAPRLLAFLCLIQLCVPGFMIARREHTLSRGRAFKFKTAPVDPYDAYRGRYVALGFEAARVKDVPPPPGSRPGDRVYALIGEDEKGFAKVTSLTSSRPEGGFYVRAIFREEFQKETLLDLPFDRYYMEEEKAPLAEAAYRQHNWREVADVYVVVRVSGSQAVIEELFIQGMPIGDFLAKPPEKAQKPAV